MSDFAPIPVDANLRIKDEALREVLQGKRFLVQDGAMGTMLQMAGLAAPGVNPDLLNLTHAEQITQIHAQYVQAGAEMVTTNTFGANRRKLEGAATVEEVFAAAVANARAAGARYVAGDVGPTGALLEPMGDLSFDQAYDLFAEQVRAAAKAGCDLIAIETMSDLAEARAALLAAKENCDLPVFVTMTFEEDGRTFLGTPPAVAATVLSSMGASAIGANCSLGPAEMVPVAQELCAHSRVPVLMRPNAGLPQIEDGQTVYKVTPQEFGEAMQHIGQAGVSIMGGCCGTNPQFIAEVAQLAARLEHPVERAVPRDFALASPTMLLSLPAGSANIAVVGERINPTGKPKLKAALREGNLDYVVAEALSQQKLGANVLDVNVGLPELDEPAVLSAAVSKLQSVCGLPLVLDSSDVDALDRAARSYAGKPLLNSVNGKAESMHAVLPLAKRYGCAVIGLTLDEEGIPNTAEGRLAVARKIVETAEGYGIPRQDVVIDCLTMAVATNQPEAKEILRAIQLVKRELGCRTTLGVSNISFGLPQRSLMNGTFLAAAFGAGLDLPILNPNDARYRDVVASYRVVCGQDVGSVEYIERCQSVEDPYAQPAGLTAAQRDQVAQALGHIAAAVGVAPAGGAGAAGAAAGTAGAAGSGAGAALSPATSAAGGAGGGADAADLPPVPEALAAQADQVRTVQQLILTGRKEPMPQAVDALLDAASALDVIDGVLIPALDEVGVRFDRGQYFLPQLMASAEAVKAGFDVVKERMAASAAEGEDAGENGAAGANQPRRVVIATVKGDIHDIGKNIVRMLLENYGFTVIDLGKDVAPEAVVAACREHNVGLVGLSALMTTTVKAMEQTIQLLKEELPHVKTFVGGAVLTPEYAQVMGADWYAKDAAASARIAEEFFAGC